MGFDWILGESRHFLYYSTAIVFIIAQIPSCPAEVVIQDVLWTKEYDDGLAENYFGTCRFVPTPCGPRKDGVCVPKGQCSNGGGWTLYDDCAGGVGECCQYVESCSQDRTQVDIHELVTNLQSPWSEPTSSTSCSFRFRKDSNICQIRLDFMEFSSTSANSDGICDTDRIRIRNSATVDNDFTTCGSLRDQHMYLTFGSEEVIEVIPQIKSDNRFYHIVATKIPCNSRARVPAHCLQYFNNGTSGQVRSFDFGGQQQSNQRYTVCVNPDSQSSEIQWRPCDNNLASFDIITNTQVEPLNCKADWVQMKGLEKTCGRFTSLTSKWKPYELMVNFDEMELPPPPPGFNIGYNSTADGPCETACPAFDTPTHMCQCGPTSDTCLCIIISYPGIPNPQIDFNNTGFCLEYLQM